MRQFYDRWIPLENAYFDVYRLPDDGTVCIHGGTSAVEDIS